MVESVKNHQLNKQISWRPTEKQGETTKNENVYKIISFFGGVPGEFSVFFFNHGAEE